MRNIDNLINKIKGVIDSIVIAKYNDNIVKGLKAYIVYNGELDKEYIKAQKELEELICSSGFKIDDISLNLDESNSKIWMRFACQR